MIPLLFLALQADPVFRANLDLIRVEVQVTDRDQPVTNLTKEAFSIFDQSQRQEIVALQTEDQPIDLVLLLDISVSMGPALEELRRRASDALAHMRPNDRVAVIYFGGQSEIGIELTSNHSAVNTVIQNIKGTIPFTEINLNLYGAVGYLKNIGPPEARRAILILTDNLGRRDISDSEVIHRLWETDTVLHSLLFRHNVNPARFGETHIEPFVEATGGENFWIGSTKIQLAEIFDRIRQRYTLLYKAPSRPPGTLCKIQIKLNDPAYKKFKIRARSGYTVGIPDSGTRRKMVFQ